jgi:hypothetical protein
MDGQISRRRQARVYSQTTCEHRTDCEDSSGAQAQSVDRLDGGTPHLCRIYDLCSVRLITAFCNSLGCSLWNVSDSRFSCSTAGLLTDNRPWALACWAPFTFMGVEISKLGSSLPTTRRGSHHYQRVSSDSIEMSSEARNPEKPDDAASGELAGIYLGILNLYTTLPQFIATGISMVVFTVLEPGKSPELAKDAHPDEHHGTEGYNGIAVCLFIGALSSVVAAVATQRFKNTA